MTDAPAQQLALPPESHHNHYLFSDHYLAHVVPTLPAWRSADVRPLLAEARAEHEWRTAEIVRMETGLNERVYALFDLTPEEVRLVETATKYRYGEVQGQAGGSARDVLMPLAGPVGAAAGASDHRGASPVTIWHLVSSPAS